MPGAQPRRAFQQRLGSAARRGAYGPPGVPGVYRVPRRTVSSVVSDAGLAAAAPPEWVQPDDVTIVGAWTELYRTQVTSDSGFPWSVWVTSIMSEREAGAMQGSGDPYPTDYSEWNTACVVLDPGNISAPPVSPTPPPGMTVEYEEPEGTLLTALLRGSLMNCKSDGSGTPQSGVWEIPHATLVPGVDVGSGTADPYVTGPSRDPVGGANVVLLTAVDPLPGGAGETAHDFETPPQTFPATTPRVGWKIGTTMAVFESAGSPGDSFTTYMFGQLADPADPSTETAQFEVEYTYRPPRYRFV